MSLGRRRRGAVLLLVLGVVALLAVVAVELCHRSELDASRSWRAALECGHQRAFLSGQAGAKGVLLEGGAWERPLSLPLGGEGDRVEVQLADETGKLNLLVTLQEGASGLAMRRSVERLFAYLRRHEPERAAEWGEIEQAVRARVGWDLAARERRPLLTLDGLREAGATRAQIFGRDGAGGMRRVALADVVTVFGDGRLNLNTAPAAAIYALDEGIDEDLAARVVAWREWRAEEQAPVARAFSKPEDLERVPGVVEWGLADGEREVVRNLYGKVQERVTVASMCYSARLAAWVGGRRREGWAFFESLPRAMAGTKPQWELVGFEELEP